MERGSIYPSWRYHVDGRSVKCLDASQDADLADWSDEDVRGQINGTPLPELTGEPEPEDAPKKKPGRPRKS
jgi:hypothetical protein